MAVYGQVEFTGSARDRAAMFDRVQKLAVFEGLQKPGTNTGYLAPTSSKVPDQLVQTPTVNASMALKAFESVNLVVQLVEGFAADVTAGQNHENLKKRRNRGPSGPVVVSVAVVEHRVIEELKPEERPHTL